MRVEMESIFSDVQLNRDELQWVFTAHDSMVAHLNTLAIVAVHHEDDALGVLVVVAPQWANLRVRWLGTASP